MEFSIREAMSSDIAECAKIISLSEAWTIFGIDYDKAIVLLDTMVDKIYVAETPKGIAGFITLRANGMGNFGAYIRMVAVKEEFRSRGIGKQLIKYIEPLTTNDNGNLFLICSLTNPKAMRFYETIGFRKVGVLNDLLIEGHHEVLFRKQIKDNRVILIDVDKDNLAEYDKLEKINDLSYFMSRTRPYNYAIKTQTTLFWKYITMQSILVGALWIEKEDEYAPIATLGIFIADENNYSKGIGSSAIVIAMLQANEKMKFTQVKLDVRASNKRAIRCYEKCGFKETGNFTKEYLGENVECIVMQRNVN